MAEAKDYQRVSHLDHPNRCASNAAGNQCLQYAQPGSLYCGLHGGPAVGRAAERVRNYRLAKWQGRNEEFADNEQVKSLREEIGILRIILEEQMTRCRDASELLLYSNKIADLVMKIEKVVSACHRLEAATGMLLDKAAVLNITNVIIDVIARHVHDDAILEKIANEIAISIVTTQHAALTP